MCYASYMFQWDLQTMDKIQSHAYTIYSVDDLYEKSFDTWTSLSLDYGEKPVCISFDKGALSWTGRSASQNIKYLVFFIFFFKKYWIVFCSFMHISIYLCNRNSTKNTFYYRQRCLINKMAAGTVLILLSTVCILSLREGSFCIWRTYLSNFCNENTQVYF